MNLKQAHTLTQSEIYTDHSVFGVLSFEIWNINIVFLSYKNHMSVGITYVSTAVNEFRTIAINTLYFNISYSNLSKQQTDLNTKFKASK